MFLGLDLGTTNIKAVVIGHDGVTAARAAVPVQLHHGPNETVEQDLNEIWIATTDALSQSLADVDSSRIQACGKWVCI